MKLFTHFRFFGLVFFFWAVALLFWLQEDQTEIAVAWLILTHLALAIRVYFNNVKLQKIEWQYHQLLTATHALPDGILLLDAENKILWVNQKLAEHMGLPSILVSQKAAQEVFIHLPDFVQFIQSESYHSALNLNSKARKLLVQIIPFQKKQKLLVTQDITALDKLNTTRQDFVANVSHELRTPLTSILGFLETLKESNQAIDPHQQEKILGIIHQQAQRMQSLVADLLTLSTLESSSIEAKQKIDVGALLQQLQPQLMSFSSKKHTIHWELAEQLSILGNLGEIQSAVTNLITNALRYTPEGGTIYIRWRLHKNGTSAVFSVQDTGPGIAEEHLARITERFYRVDKGRSREAGGTGLGLAIVKHIAIRHQAKLDIQSTIGTGSCFSLIFNSSRTAGN